jgi:hypothetical protein
MKIALPWEQFNDDEGRPLVNGRVSVFKHDSDTLADVFTLVGDDYTQAQNPFYTADDGRVPTVWFEAAVVDIRLEKRNPDGTYEPLDTFQAGFDMPSAKNSTFVYTMDALRDVDPSVGIVTVCGYFTDFDCPPRTYVWDQYCTLSSDGGVVIDSNVGEEGRWILLYDDEKLPSCFYGVFAGDNEANISAFVNYQDYVGSYRIRTPKMPRFLGGTYTTAGALLSTKTIYFDKGATFNDAEIQCYSAVVPENNTYVAEFYFVGSDVTAHSSWFRTIDGFLTCNAKTLVVDGTNYFFDNQVKVQRNLSGVELAYPTNTRLPITYVNSGKLRLDNINISGHGVFDATDKLVFVNTVIHDAWWTSPNSVDWVNNVSAKSISNNKLVLANFDSVYAYIDAIKADGATEIDLSGRPVNVWTDDQFTDVRNVVCNQLTVDMSGQEVKFHNVVSRSCYVDCRYFYCDEGCDVTFSSEPVVSAAWFTDSNIHGSTWAMNIPYEFKRCAVDISFNRVQNNEYDEYDLTFEDCQLLENRVIESKSLVMVHCTTLNNTIRVYPYYDSDNSFYRMRVKLEGNVFNNNTPIEFTRIELDDGGNHNESVTDIRVDWYIVGNMFSGNSEGLRCRYWQYRFGNHAGSVFIYRGDYNESSVTYKGNVGLCPSGSGKGISCTDFSIDDWYIHTVGDDKYSYFIANWGSKRLMPNVRDAGAAYSLFYLGTRSVDDDEYSIKTFDGADLHIERTTLFMYPRSSRDNDSNGDFFLHAPCMIGEVTQAAPGDTHTWRYLP